MRESLYGSCGGSCGNLSVGSMYIYIYINNNNNNNDEEIIMIIIAMITTAIIMIIITIPKKTQQP